ncbi:MULTISPECIES: plasmid pRiA4b ORF-3 family protein [Gracilibacillus]|uniref:plasmid pRiA4b ORF-3 family protein n=1 Tax=Gracilibacillus TaxID=74385 RepID=UPI000826CFA0|nr:MULTISPECIES: plasmid pRiA4b ORF-3 family protein [Gracilibacillus]
MTLQLRIDLKHVENPKWRTLLVSEETTFEEFHMYLQVAFDWSNSHMHIFNQKNLTISPIIEGIFGEENDLDETEVTLGAILQEPNDRVSYIYDLGDHWEHEIILEKQFTASEDHPLPVCIAAEGDEELEEPELEEWDEQLELPLDTEQYSENELLLDDINFMLEPFQEMEEEYELENEEIYQQKHSPTEQEWNLLFDYIEEIKQLKPWETLTDTQIVGIWSTELGDYMYASIMGNGEVTYGISFFPGSKALLQFFQSTEEEEPSIDLRQRAITVYLNNRDELEPEEYDLIKSLGRSYRGKHEWPSFLSLAPNKMPWMIDHEEALLLISVLPVLRIMIKELKDKDVPESGDHIFAVNQKGQDIYLSIDDLIQEVNESFDVSLNIPELEIKRLKKEKSPLAQNVELGIVPFPEPVQDTPNSRPYLPHMFVMVEQESQLVMHFNITELGDSISELQEKSFHFLQSIEQLPQQVYMRADDYAEIIRPIFEALDISLTVVNELEGVNVLLETMLEDKNSPFYD